MKTFAFVFLTSFLLYVTDDERNNIGPPGNGSLSIYANQLSAPAPHRSPSTRSQLTDRDHRLLKDILCILQGKTSDDCIDGDDGINERKRGIDSPAMEEEEEAIAPLGLSFKGVPDRRDAFYSDWKRRK